MKRAAFLPNFHAVTVEDDDGAVQVNMDLEDLRSKGIHAIQYDAASDTYEVEFIKPANVKLKAAEFKAKYGAHHVTKATALHGDEKVRRKEEQDKRAEAERQALALEAEQIAANKSKEK